MDEETEVTVEDLQRELSAVKSKNEQVIGINKKLSDKLDSMESGKKELLEKMQTDEERRLIERGDFDALVQMKSQAVVGSFVAELVATEGTAPVKVSNLDKTD